MAQPLVLTFDMGTQSARAMLVNQHGEIVCKQQKVYEKPYFSLQPGWAEQKAAFYWDAICETSLGLKEKAGDAWNDIIAVTCTSIRDTCLCVDESGEPLRNVILWLDSREAHDISPIPAGTSLMLRLVQMSEAMELQRRVSACNWIEKHEPDIWAKTHTFVLISAWFNFKLCGNLADSVASTIGHVPFDVKARSWMKENNRLRIIFNVPNEKLCPLVEAGETLGHITAAAAAQTGIPEGLPLIATGSDKGCETLGLSCSAPNKAALSFGTTSTVQITTENYVEPLPFIPPYPAVVKGHYNPEVEIFRGYWLVSWFKKEFGAKEVEEAKTLGVAPEELLNKRLHEIPPGCDGLVMQPYFTPGVIMPHAKGAVIGFSDVHTRIHLYRAIIEGINFGLMEGLHGIEKRGKLKVDELYVAGGGSQSDEICQITASMFGLPVVRTQTHEVSGVGSSLVAFVSMGVYPGYAEACAAMVHERDRFLPNMKEHAVYRRLYEEVYTKVFDKLAPLYKTINEITAQADLP